MSLAKGEFGSGWLARAGPPRPVLRGARAVVERRSRPSGPAVAPDARPCRGAGRFCGRPSPAAARRSDRPGRSCRRGRSCRGPRSGRGAAPAARPPCGRSPVAARPAGGLPGAALALRDGRRGARRGRARAAHARPRGAAPLTPDLDRTAARPARPPASATGRFPGRIRRSRSGVRPGRDERRIGRRRRFGRPDRPLGRRAAGSTGGLRARLRVPRRDVGSAHRSRAGGSVSAAGRPEASSLRPDRLRARNLGLQTGRRPARRSPRPRAQRSVRLGRQRLRAAAPCAASVGAAPARRRGRSARHLASAPLAASRSAASLPPRSAARPEPGPSAATSAARRGRATVGAARAAP